MKNKVLEKTIFKNISSYKYWNRRYKKGGNSGLGSIGKLGEWKFFMIVKHFTKLEHSTILDVGCGDMSFWGDKFLPPNYVGIDQSDFIINKNTEKFKFNKFLTENFCNANIDVGKFDVLLCFDVLFHVTDDVCYFNILHNIVNNSKGFIFIYTWKKNPLIDKEEDYFQKYRDFNKEEYQKIFKNANFDLVKIEETSIDPVGAMWIYKKSDYLII